MHDTGRLSPTVDQEIATGQVWTVEPGVYIEGFGGIRIEDDVLVVEDGQRVLGRPVPKSIVEVEALSAVNS